MTLDSSLTCGSISVNNFHNGLPANLAHKSHSALIIAATAKCMTPLSGPSCIRRIINIHINKNLVTLKKIDLVSCSPNASACHWSIHARTLRSGYKCLFSNYGQLPWLPMLPRHASRFHCLGHR